MADVGNSRRGCAAPGRLRHLQASALLFVVRATAGNRARGYPPSAMQHREEIRGRATMPQRGEAPYPVERTLLTTGLVAAGMRSLAAGQKHVETPHLAVRYQGP